MSEYDESTEWTGHYGSWLQSRGLKRTTDRVEAFHAGYLAQKDEVTRLRAENAELRKLVDLHINTKIVAERVATNFIDRVQKERDEALKNYQFMVERAADQHLDGYRELGDQLAKLEIERDTLRTSIAVHELACAGVWRPTGEEFPPDGWVGDVLFEDWSDGIVKLRESRAMHTNHAGYQFLEGSPGTIGVRIAYWRALKDYGGSSVSSLEAALQVGTC